MMKYSKTQIILASLFASIILGTAAFYFYSVEKSAIHKEKYEYLKAIASLKIDQIEKWRNERLSEAKFFPTVGKFIKSTVFLKENIGDKEAREFLTETLLPIKEQHSYKNFFIVDVNGNVLFYLDSTRNEIDSVTIFNSMKAVDQDTLFFSDFYYCESHSEIHFDIYSPIKNNNNNIIAVFILEIDPKDYLFPMIQKWPTPSKTAETLVYRDEKTHVRLLTKGKFLNNDQLDFTVTIDNKEHVSVKGINNNTGIVDGIDYKNSKVLAAISHIKGTDWYLVSKVDKSEIYQDLLFKGWAIIILVVISLLLIFVTAMYLYRLRQSQVYKNLFFKERELYETQEGYRTTLYCIGDAVITTDSNGFIKNMNSVAEQLTGWKEAEGFGKKLNQVFKVINEDTNKEVEDPVTRVLQCNTIVGLANHTLLIKKDGTRIPIADSGSPIKDEKGDIIGVVLVFRDQTEERAKERAILESEEKYRRMTLNSPMGMHFYELNENNELVLVGSNPAADILLGFDHSKIYGKTIEQAFPPLANTEVSQKYRVVASDGILWNTEQITYKDEKIEGAFEVKAYQTKPNNMVAVFTDITQRKQFEAALKNEKDRINAILNLVGDPIFVKDNQHRFTLGNKAFYEMVGFDENKVIGKTLAEDIPEDEMEHFLKIDRLVLDTGVPDTREEELTINNQTRTIITNKTRFIDDSGNRLLIGSLHDITDRVNAEKEKAHFNDLMKYIISNTKSSVSVLDTQMNFIYVSDRYFDDFHLTDKNIIGRNHYDVFPDLPQFLRDIHKRALSGETISGEDDPLVNPDGSMDWANWTCMPWYKTDGKIGGIIIYLEVITSQKIVEETLRASEQKYRMLLDFAGDAFFQGDTQGNFITVNNKAIDLTGYSREELLGMNIKDLFSEAVLDSSPLRYDKLLAGETFKTERVVLKKDGNRVDVEMTSKQMPDGTFQSFFKDITERISAENEIKAAEERFKLAFTTSPDSININKLSDGCYITINNGFTKMTGYTEKEVIGKTSAEIQIWADIKYWNELVEKLKTKNVVDNFETKFRIKDGSIKDGLMSASIIELNGEHHIISITRDITERKRADEILKLSETNLKNSQRVAKIGHYDLDVVTGVWSSSEMLDVIFGIEENYNHDVDGWAKLLHPDDREMMMNHFLIDVIKNKNEFNKVYRIISNNNNEVKWVYGLGVIELDENNSVIRMFGTIQDITEIKKAEEEILKTKIHYQKLIENAPDGIVQITIDGEFKYVSTSAKRIFGHPLNERVEESPNSLTHPDDLQNVLNVLNEVIKNPYLVPTIQYRFKHTNGSWLWIESTFTNLLAEPSVEAIVINFRDITDSRNAANALKESEELYRTLINTSPDAVSVTDLEGNILFVSNKALQIFGNASMEEVVGHNVLEWVIPVEQLKAAEYFKFLMSGNEQRDKEILLVRKDGSTFYGEISAAPVYGSDGKPSSVILVTRDISQRKKIEESIRKLSRAVEQSPTTIVITDIHSNIEYVNPKFTEVTGYTFEEVKGQNPRILSSGNTASEDFTKMWQTILTGSEWRGEFHNKKKNGETYWESASISPITDSNNNITHFVALKEDITEKKKMLEQLSNSEEEFRSIWESSVDAMRLVDENGVIINVNNSYCNLFGLKKEDLIGHLFNVSYTITEKDTTLRGFRERFKNATIVKKFETEIQLKSGKIIWVELTNSFIRFEDKASMLLSIIRDITDRKLLIIELTDAKNKAEEMNKVKSYFFANMSHELRTPFVGILGFAEILKDTLQNSEEREYAEQILKSSKRLTDTLNKILNVTRLEFDKIDLKYKEIDVFSLLKNIENFYQTSAKLNNTTITTKIENESIFIRSDLKLIEDILNNLVSNAVKFTHDGSIKLSAQEIFNNDKYHISIKVEDSGIGIPKEKQSVVWQEFRQASEGFNRSFEGTGLGLTITKKYVEILGGEISLESEENVGTVFTILLPRNNTKISELETEVKISNPRKTNIGKSKTRKHKILYVEDDIVALQFINIILKSTYEVETAFKAKAALELAEKENYDVLMLDINLGTGMDGVELMQKIRQIDYYKNIPIVAVTAYAAQSDKKEFLAKGFTHYISKPFTKKELFSLLQEVLSN